MTTAFAEPDEQRAISQRILRLWDIKLDTVDIGRRLNLAESIVANRLAELLEVRRA